MALEIVDFHSHFTGREHAHPVFKLLSDEAALKASLDEQGIACRAISTPPEFIRNGDDELRLEQIQRANERIARVADSDSRLLGFATVDAYAGQAAAEELVRAVRQLGLRGVFVESAKGELFPDCEAAQPAFAAAASLGVPVFLHPVPDKVLKARFSRCGRMSERLTRGAVNSAAVFAMMESGMFERHRDLKVVVTALALGGLLLGGPLPAGLYIDTTGHHPVMLRAAIELLGPSKVITGTDWPVVQEKALPERLEQMLGGFGLGAADRRKIAGTNAKELLGL